MPLPVNYIGDEALLEKLRWALDVAEQTAGALRITARRLAWNLLSPETSDAQTRRRPDKNRLRELIRSISPEARYWSALDLEFRRFLVDLANDVSVDEDGDAIYGEQVASRWHRMVGREARRAFEEVARELGDTLRVLKAVALVQDRFHAHLRRALNGSMR